MDLIYFITKGCMFTKITFRDTDFQPESRQGNRNYLLLLGEFHLASMLNFFLLLGLFKPMASLQSKYTIVFFSFFKEPPNTTFNCVL